MGLSSLADNISPDKRVHLTNHIFYKIDDKADALHIENIKTIGDS
ncbi:MAG: hypothetical protein IPM47_07660 [Sphingobacteriales bacterium]|nr:MAG: hypothetical protein IPM47_07660 [Sphingobacteriales bacterium]